jgi:hypothetical protein
MMRNRCRSNPCNPPRLLATVLLAAVFLTLAGCNVHKQGEGKNEKVDINTPVGSLHINKQPDPKEIGLPLYPGAQPASDKNDEGANVNIDSSMFGIHVVAMKYTTSDASSSVLDFYRKELKTYGDVRECQGEFSVRTTKEGAQAARCVPSHTKIELAAGTEDRQRFVSVKPLATGCSFELVYVQTRGEREPL